jgi:hypothetical protein
MDSGCGIRCEAAVQHRDTLSTHRLVGVLRYGYDGPDGLDTTHRIKNGSGTVWARVGATTVRKDMCFDDEVCVYLKL